MVRHEWPYAAAREQTFSDEGGGRSGSDPGFGTRLGLVEQAPRTGDQRGFCARRFWMVRLCVNSEHAYVPKNRNLLIETAARWRVLFRA